LVNINRFVSKAPVLVVIVGERQKLAAKLGGLVKDRDFSLMDVGIAAEHFCLQAAEEGLGTCMLGWFNEKPARKLLGVPAARRVELIVSVGYAADDAIPQKKRKAISEIVAWNRYQ
jgi:nitroreductase